MTVLAIQLPPRERLSARVSGPEAASGMRLPTEWPFVFSADGRNVTQTGSAALALLPRADHTVLVLAEADVSWHAIDIPKAPPARLRAALLGVMEDALLEDEDALHFALAPDTQPGRKGWVAVTHRPRLLAALAALEAGGASVERVVSASLPASIAAAEAEPSRGHFFRCAGHRRRRGLAVAAAARQRLVPAFVGRSGEGPATPCRRHRALDRHARRGRGGRALAGRTGDPDDRF